MNIFECKIDVDDETGVDAISLVEYPAIEIDWVAFAKQTEKVAKLKLNSEKRIITGPALIPEKKIYRKDERGEHYLFFSKETIESVAQKFFKLGNHKKSTYDHKIELDSNYIFESWIVEDSLDKSNKLGFDVPEGTWMVSMKIEDDETWEKIKSGEVRGFSIEGLFSHMLKKEDAKEDAKEDKKEEFSSTHLKSIVKQVFNLFTNNPKKLHFMNTKLQSGEEIFIDEDSKAAFYTDTQGVPKEQLLKGTYTLIDGTIITVNDEGVITSEQEPETEQEPESESEPEQEPETETSSEIVLEDGTIVTVNDSQATIGEEPAPKGFHFTESGSILYVNEEGMLFDNIAVSTEFKEMLQKLMKTNKELEDEKEELSTKVENLSKAPSAPKITSNVDMNSPMWKRISESHQKLTKN
jgi:hypothetical protein